MELLRGPEHDPPPIEVLIFMGIGSRTSEGRLALENYNRKIYEENKPPETALEEVLEKKSYLSGAIVDLRDQLLEPPSN